MTTDPEQARRERTAIIAIAVTVLALTNLPYLWGMIIDAEGQVFSGFVFTFTFFDIMSYLAKMRDGLEGRWFYTNPFTTEDAKPVFLFVFYIALGHVARLTGLSLILVYHLARIMGGIFLIASVDRMIRRLGWHGATRLLAFSLVFFAGGFGWIFRWSRSDEGYVEFMQTEGFVFQSMLSYPHFVLSIALMVWILTDAWLFALKGKGYGLLAGSALAAFILAWVHPRPMLTICAASGAAAIWGAARGHWSIRPWILFVVVLLAVVSGPMIVSILTVRADPLWAEWSRTETLSAPPWRYLIAYGLLWPLSLTGLVRASRRNEPWAPLLGGWLLVGSLLPFLPIASQVRLIIGWNIPLALLSGYALGEVIIPKLQAGPPALARATPALVSALILLLSLSAVAYLGVGVWRVLVGSFPGYFSRERAEAMDWLATHTASDDTVLASSFSSMFIPAYAGNRVVQGHWAETFHQQETAERVRTIFDGDTSEKKRRELLREFGVRYMLYSQWEGDLGDYDPTADPSVWTPRWTGTATSIFEHNR